MRIPGFVLKKMLKIYLYENIIEFNFSTPMMGGYQPLGSGLEKMIIGVKDTPLFDMELYPNDYHMIYNNEFYPNHEIHNIMNRIPQRGDSYSIIVPNRANTGTGKQIFYFGTRGISTKINVKLEVLYSPHPIQIPTSQTSLKPRASQQVSTTATFDFNTQRICPKCGSAIRLEHNFCKYCGQDLSDVEPLGKGDAVLKSLAETALTDPSPDIRKEAIDTLGGFKDTKLLGLLTYILINDPDEEVRREAADELGDIHHPLSMEALSGALKDPSSLVRKEALQGLKKIKEKDKPKKEDSVKDKKEKEKKVKEKSDKEKKVKEKMDKESED